MRRSVLALWLCACNGGGSDVDTNADGPLRAVDHGTVASEQGWAIFEVEVAEGDTSFLVNVFGDDIVSLDRILDPDEDIALFWEDWQGDYALTNAFYACSGSDCQNDFAVNWPVREVDGPLAAGVWQVVVFALDADYSYLTGSAVRATTLVKRDDDVEASTVRVRIVYARGVQETEGVPEAIEAAVEHWREIWAPHGLDLEVRYDSADIDPRLGFPNSDNDAIAAASAGSDPGELTMLVGEDIDQGLDWLGYSGGIPGALVEGPQSAVIVGWLAGAGTDGEFGESDITILAGTMAHEVGHFQGLYHPVEAGFDSWDALDDTPDCTRQVECVEDGVANNLMYMETVFDIGPQEELTPEQVGVIMRYVGSP